MREREREIWASWMIGCVDKIREMRFLDRLYSNRFTRKKKSGRKKENIDGEDAEKGNKASILFLIKRRKEGMHGNLMKMCALKVPNTRSDILKKSSSSEERPRERERGREGGREKAREKEIVENHYCNLLCRI